MPAIRVDNRAKWEVANFQDVSEEMQGYGFIVAQLLLQRGIVTKEQGERFLRPDLANLGNPSEILDLDRAVERIKAAIADKEWIVVYGDYDVDGVTSSTVLTSAIRELGGKVDVYLPERLKEGYGLNIPALQQLKDEGADLIIAVDNGTAAVEQIAFANTIGLDVVVVDHHEPHGELPAAYALVNPKRPGSNYYFKECAAVGVAYHVARKLLGDVPAQKYLDLVAVGTVADVVPLIEDNRIFAVEGLKLLNKTTRPGLLALIEAAGIKGKTLEVYHLGFQLGPRLNAAGRIDHARLAFDLLNAPDYFTAMVLAKQLNDLNARRQSMTEVMLEAAKQQQSAFAQEKIILLGAEGWSIGVAGIVAGRLVEAYSKPAIVFEYQEEYCKGSGRSVDDVNIVELLNQVADDLDHYGGHAKAAGLSVKKEKFAGFKKRLEDWSRDNIDEKLLVPKVKISVLLEGEHVDSQLLASVERLSPFGFGNSTPTFAIKGLTFLRCEPIGYTKVGKLFFETPEGKQMNFICFDYKELIFDLDKDSNYDVAFTVGANNWKDRTYMELKVCGLRDAG